ncbi:MAG TPA: hypothetical protein VI757_11800 [Bacteroidia bacterium]|nr:hypothetical protein [Bacteroidia bacterium]
MSEIRITFDKEWSVERRMQAIQQRQTNLKDCRLLKLQLEKEYSRVGSVVKVETTDWRGLAEQELMLKTATSFLITYEH